MTKQMNRREFVRTGAAVGLGAATLAQVGCGQSEVSGQAAPSGGAAEGAGASDGAAQVPPISRQFAQWAANLKFEDLPPEVVDKVKGLLVHAVSGAVLGAPKPFARTAMDLLVAEEGKADGATILTDGRKASRLGATQANLELMHASTLIDSYRMRTHPGPVFIPVALANAELERRNGKDLITALAAGYEFMCRLSYDFTPTLSSRAFQPSSVFCTMGAAMVAGKLLGLDEAGILGTISLATNYASGLVESSWQGDRQAARSGVLAGVMARTGNFRPADRPLEGEAGFYRAFAGSNTGKLTYAFTGPTQIDLGSITAGLGTSYKLLTVMFRMYGTSGYNDPVINLMVEMKEKHRLNPDDIARVAIAMNWHETLYPSPEFPTNPNWNTPRAGGGTHFVAAHAAVNGGYPVVGGKTFGPTGSNLAEDQKVIDFMNRAVTLVPEKDRAMFSPAITVTMKDGTTHRGEYPYERLEWTFDQLVPHLQGCVPGYSLGQQGFDALVDTMRGVDRLASVDRIFQVTKA